MTTRPVLARLPVPRLAVPRPLAVAVLLNAAVGSHIAATAGGWAAPLFDVPPPLPAAAAPPSAGLNPYAIGIPLLIGLCVAHVICPAGDGAAHRDDPPSPPVRPPADPVDPAPVPLPGAAGALTTGLALLALRRSRRARA